MLLSNPEFVENSEYGFAVARIRALENRLITGASFNQLINSSEERFIPFLEELAGIGIKEEDTVDDILEKLEWNLTETFFLVKGLLIEDEYKRLISLKYDYELLKLIIKEQGGGRVKSHKYTSLRSNYTYPVMKSLIEAGNFLDLGKYISAAYQESTETKSITGKEIDIICDRAYFNEVFDCLNSKPNPFIEGFYRRKIDTINLTSMLRLKNRGEKRPQINEVFIPNGSIDIDHFEESFDLTFDAISTRLNFAWFSNILQTIPKGGEEDDNIALLERVLDEGLMNYLKESIYVTFGVEPVISYLFKMELQTNNLRLIVLSRYSGLSADEIKRNVRGMNE